MKHVLSQIYFKNIQMKPCNIRLKQMKHLKHTLETCVYSHSNTCNIEIYFCNIQMKYLQHESETCETLETSA